MTLIHHSKLIRIVFKCTPQLTMRHVYQIQTQLLTSTLPLECIKPTMKLIEVCGNSANTRHAALIFTHHLTLPDIVAYRILFKAFAQNNEWSCIISRFNALLAMPHAPPPDACIFAHVIKACSRLAQELEGRKVHCLITKHGCDSNLWVGNSLMDFYFKFGNFRVAHKLFDEMPVRDVATPNILISGYCLSGDVDKARRVFDGMVERDVVSWSAMIACYVRNDKYGDAIDLFRQMQQQSGLVIDAVTLVSVLSACARLGALDMGKWIHGFIRQSKMKLNLWLGNALVDMYSKCGCIVDARRVFDAMQEKDVMSWTTIIDGLAMHGHANEAFSCFREMLEHGVRPDDVTFIGLLTACTHSGMVDKGLEYFHMMDQVYGISPTNVHYGCVVDLLSRSGHLDEAEKLIRSMPMKPDVKVWGALLRGCQIYEDAERGERAARRILELEPSDSVSFVYLANIYASMGRPDDAEKCWLSFYHIKRCMRDNGVMKTPGRSWIEVDKTQFMSSSWGTSKPLVR